MCQPEGNTSPPGPGFLGGQPSLPTVEAGEASVTEFCKEVFDCENGGMSPATMSKVMTSVSSGVLKPSLA